MLVQFILDLINNLKKEELNNCDLFFCNKLEQHFTKKEPQLELTSEEINLIFHLYKDRLKQIGAKIDPLREKKYWIIFVQELAAKKDYKLEDLLYQKPHPCWLFLIYLLNTRFEVSMFDKKTICLWDKENKVSTENGKLYNELIKTGTREMVERTYEQCLNEQLINEEVFLKKEIYWFEPEVLLASFGELLDTGIIKAFKLEVYEAFEIEHKITKFLDQLIQTYAQTKGELFKALRTNLLFNEMISGLNNPIQDIILMSLANRVHGDDKKYFIVNSMNYISKRLGQLESSTHPKDCIHFFSRTYKRVNIPHCEESVTFSAVIIHFKDKLKQYEPIEELGKSDLSRLDPSVYDKLFKYLSDLGNPILSVDEKDQASSCAKTSDYLGLRS